MNNVHAILSLARAKNKTIGAVESLTGGMLLAKLTSISGASEVVKGGLVTYTNEEKEKFLHISKARLIKYGAISSEIAGDMAKIGRYRLNVDVCIALTGNAGPRASEGKPVGLVYLGVATPQTVTVEQLNLVGTRTQIRKQAMTHALRLIESTLKY